ncbi:MAG TPA: hypothetical protein VHE81_14235 [Lacipirellulaceae bacterium]|nr:hypothetical protein [Lacipirellulaceae bacterium]
MSHRTIYLFAAFAACLTISSVRGQQVPPGGRERESQAKVPEPPGLNTKYKELTHSTDSHIRSLAERYVFLTRLREWDTASGKSVLAQYVSHESDLSRVKLAVPKGTGQERTYKEYDVELEKLSKVAQARVKQIDALQKKLDELSSAGTKQGNSPGGQSGPGISAEAPGNSRVAEGPGAATLQPGAPERPEARGPDPSASEPDPLGFAELTPVAAPVVAGPGAAPLPPSAGSVVPKALPPAGPVDRTQWRTNIAAFVANISVSTDPTGNPTVNWGELRELREMNDLAMARQTPVGRSTTTDSTDAISKRLGEVHWHLILEKVEPAPGGMVNIQFRSPELPKPVELHIALDDGADSRKWATIAPGTSVNVNGRLIINEPNVITAKVKPADAK